MAEHGHPAYVRAGKATSAEPHAAGRSAPVPAPSQAARFSLLYESRDRRLCLFEDADGHLTSVDADRLA